MGDALSLHTLFILHDGFTEALFVRDPFFPYLAGLFPKVLVEDNAASADGDAALDDTIRSAFSAAGNFLYVDAAAHADRLRTLTVARTSITGPVLRARFALDLLASAGVSLEAPEGAPELAPLENPPDVPRESAYHDFLWVRTAADPTDVFQAKSARILAALPENKEQTKRALFASLYRKTGDCSPLPLPVIEEAPDLILSNRLAGALQRGDAKADAAHLELPAWYARYTHAVSLTEASRSAWTYLPSLLYERGDSAGLSPAGSNAHAQAGQLGQQHIKALLALERSAPERFRTFSQLALVFNPGVLGDAKLRELVIELTRAGAQDKIAAAKDAAGVFDGLLAGGFAGISFPPAVQEAYWTALAGAFTAKLKGDLRQKTGWGVAGLYALDAAYRLIADQTPNLAFSSEQIDRALSREPAYPGLAALAVSAARYAALGFSGKLAVLPKDSPKISDERKAAQQALRSAIAALGDGGDAPPEKVLDDAAELADGLIAVLSASFQAAQNQKAKEQTVCRNAKTPFVTDPEARRALEKLGDVRRRILSHPRVKSGQDAWARRARMLFLILSDAMDVASKKEGKPRFLIPASGAELIVKEALSDWGERDAANALGSGYGVLRAVLETESAEQFLAAQGGKVRDVMKGLALFFRSGDAGKGTKPKNMTLLDALAAVPLSASSDLMAMCLGYAEYLYGQGEVDQGDLWLLATLVISGLKSVEPQPKALELAAKHSKRVSWAMLFLKELAKTRNGVPPDIDAYAPLMKEAMDDACVAAENADDMLGAMGAVRLWTLGKRDEARAALDTLLDKVEANGLSIPKMTYKYEERTETKVLSVSLGISYGGGLLSGSNSFQIGLGIKSKGEPGGAMTAVLSPSDSAAGTEESARFYVHAAALSSVYHFLSGDAQRASKAAQRVISALSVGSRLKNRVLSNPNPEKWTEDARTPLALSAQLAAEANLPFLAGDLWTVMRSSLPKDADDETIDKLLEDEPFGLAKTPELAAILTRTKKTLRTLAAPLACTNAKVAPALHEEPTCDAYPLSLSLRIADVLPKLPHIGRADPKSSPKCAAMKSLDGFLTGMETGTYDPDALMRSVDALLALGQKYDAATLLTRQRKDTHCNPAIVAGARSLAADQAILPMMRADLLGTAINCELPQISDAFLGDLGQLSDAVSKVADPLRSVRVLLFAVDLSLRKNDPRPLAKLVSAPDFVNRWMGMSPLMATLALLLDHASEVLSHGSVAKDRQESSFASLCTLFPPGDRASLCADIEALRDAKTPASVRKQHAQKALETAIREITAPPKTTP